MLEEQGFPRLNQGLHQADESGRFGEEKIHWLVQLVDPQQLQVLDFAASSDERCDGRDVPRLSPHDHVQRAISGKGLGAGLGPGELLHGFAGPCRQQVPLRCQFIQPVAGPDDADDSVRARGVDLTCRGQGRRAVGAHRPAPFLTASRVT